MEFNQLWIPQRDIGQIRPMVPSCYMGLDIGQIQPDFSRYHHYPRHLHDMRVAIQVELEKERIRGEIIMSEIARRRFSEAELRREMMMERESALARGIGGFPFGSSQQMEFHQPIRLPLLETRPEMGSYSLHNGMYGDGGLYTLQFQRGTLDSGISEAKPVSKDRKRKRNSTLLAKHDEGASGSKRKAVTPPGVDASVLKKKAKEKKHNSKEAAPKAERASNGLSPKRDIMKSIVGTVDAGAEQNCGSGLSPKKATIKSIIRDRVDAGADPVAESKVSKKTQKNDCKFRCELCNLEVRSRKDIDAHEKGKKHIKRLKQMDQNSGANHGKNITTMDKVMSS